MARVAMLAHVKESAVVEPPPPPPSRAGARIAWTGGKIVTNKDEALRKFYERKLLRNGGAALSDAQRRALEASIAKLGGVSPSSSTTTHLTMTPSSHPKKKSKHDVVHKVDPAAARYLPHRANIKATSHHNRKKTIVVNGRVVGPRVAGKSSSARGAKPTFKKTPKRQQQHLSDSSRSKGAESKEAIALHDKLGMSLDALVKRNIK